MKKVYRKISSFHCLFLATGIGLILILSLATRSFARPPLILNSSQDKYRLGNYIEILEDPSGGLGLEDILSPKYADRFKPAKSEVQNLGYTKSAYWIRFSCVNDVQKNKDWVVELEFPNMHYVDFYKPASNGNYDVVKTGNMRPPASRDIHFHRYVFSLSIPYQKENTFYMRFQNGASMTLPLTVWSTNAFYQTRLFNLFGLGLAFGILLIMGGYNFFFFFALKDRSYLYFTLSIFFTLLSVFSLSGIAYLYIWPSLTWWNAKSIILFKTLAIIMFLKFTDNFLNLKTQLPKSHVTLNFLLVILCIQFALIPFVRCQYGILPVLYLQAIALFFSIGIGFLSVRKRYPPATYFFISVVVFLFTGNFRVLVRLGWMPSNWFTENGYIIGLAVGVWLLSLALADRINLIKSESEKTNLELINQEKKYHSIFVNIQDIYYEITMNGIITEVSPSVELNTQYTREELIGKKISEIFPDTVKRKQFVDEILETGKINDLEVLLKDKDGSMHCITTVSLLIRDERGAPSKIVGSLRDISDKKLLEDKLLQIEKMESISTLAGGIAHDFSNLLTAINGYAELGAMEYDESHPCHRYFRSILSTGQKASNLTRQLLTFSRKQVIEPRTININSVITDLNKMLPRLIEEDIRIETRLNHDISTIRADTGQIEQILINLVVNARDAIKQKTAGYNEKRITISTDEIQVKESLDTFQLDRKQGTYIVLSVRDTGVGIKDHVKKRIFEPFFTTKEQGKGTGLGLSTIYGIVKQNKGTIEVFSETNIGTTFNIYWPVFQDLSSQEGETHE